MPSALFLFVGLFVSYSDLLSSFTLGDVGTRCRRKSGWVSNPGKKKKTLTEPFLKMMEKVALNGE